MLSRLSSFVVALTVFAFGLAASTPSVFGCAGQGGSSCKDATPAGLDALALVADLIRAASVWLP